MRFSKLPVFIPILLFGFFAWAAQFVPDGFFPGKQIRIEAISQQQALDLFKEFQDSGIPFGYAPDGCYARATKMALIAEKKGIKMAKIYVEGDLYFDSKNPQFGNQGMINWAWHVAPILAVHQDGKEVLMVFDPSLSDRPLKEFEWLEKMKGKIESIYYTERFQYYARGRSNGFEQRTTTWRPEDILSGEQTLKEYSRLVDPKMDSELMETMKRFTR